jgi:hypothetical protein
MTAMAIERYQENAESSVSHNKKQYLAQPGQTVGLTMERGGNLGLS